MNDVTDVEEQSHGHVGRQSAAQKRADCGHSVRRLVEHEMPGIGERRHRTVRQEGGPRRRQRSRKQSILLAPHHQAGDLDPAEPARHDAIEGMIPEHQRRRAHLAVAVDGEVDVVRIFGQVRLQRLEAMDEPADQLVWWDAEQVVDLHAGHAQAGRGDEHEATQAVLLLDGEARGDEAAERETDEVDVVRQGELVEQVGVVQHEVVHLAQVIEIARLAETGMERHEHSVVVAVHGSANCQPWNVPAPWKKTSGGAS